MARIALVGSLTFDRLMICSGNFTDYFLPEKLSKLSVSFLVDQVTQEYGGTAGNIGYNLSLLALPSDIIATVGTDAEFYLEHLNHCGITTKHIRIAQDRATATAYVLTDARDNQISPFHPGACALAYEGTYPLENVGLMIVSPTSIADMERFPKEAKNAGIPLFFDPGQQIPALSAAALSLGITDADIVFVNEYELSMLIEKTGWTEAEIASRTRLLIVTLGNRGSRLVTSNGENLVPPVFARSIDPTGAGDAYRAGFIYGYTHSMPDIVSAKIGSTLAAFAVESSGCQNHTPDMMALKERYEGTYGEAWPL